MVILQFSTRNVVQVMGTSGLGSFACKAKQWAAKKNRNKCETRKESVGNQIVTKTNAICGSNKKKPLRFMDFSFERRRRQPKAIKSN